MEKYYNFLDEQDYIDPEEAKERLLDEYELSLYEADMIYSMWRKRYMTEKISFKNHQARINRDQERVEKYYKDKGYIYALYKGDRYICTGTITEISKLCGVKPRTIYNYTKPSYLRKAEENGWKNYKRVLLL